jgi:hypothetical protein
VLRAKHHQGNVFNMIRPISGRPVKVETRQLQLVRGDSEPDPFFLGKTTQKSIENVNLERSAMLEIDAEQRGSRKGALRRSAPESNCDTSQNKAFAVSYLPVQFLRIDISKSD